MALENTETSVEYQHLMEGLSASVKYFVFIHCSMHPAKDKVKCNLSQYVPIRGKLIQETIDKIVPA